MLKVLPKKKSRQEIRARWKRAARKVLEQKRDVEPKPFSIAPQVVIVPAERIFRLSISSQDEGPPSPVSAVSSGADSAFWGRPTPVRKKSLASQPSLSSIASSDSLTTFPALTIPSEGYKIHRSASQPDLLSMGIAIPRRSAIVEGHEGAEVAAMRFRQERLYEEFLEASGGDLEESSKMNKETFFALLNAPRKSLAGIPIELEESPYLRSERIYAGAWLRPGDSRHDNNEPFLAPERPLAHHRPISYSDSSLYPMSQGMEDVMWQYAFEHYAGEARLRESYLRKRRGATFGLQDPDDPSTERSIQEYYHWLLMKLWKEGTWGKMMAEEFEDVFDEPMPSKEELEKSLATYKESRFRQAIADSVTSVIGASEEKGVDTESKGFDRVERIGLDAVEAVAELCLIADVFTGRHRNALDYLSGATTVATSLLNFGVNVSDIVSHYVQGSEEKETLLKAINIGEEISGAIKAIRLHLETIYKAVKLVREAFKSGFNYNRLKDSLDVLQDAVRCGRSVAFATSNVMDIVGTATKAAKASLPGLGIVVGVIEVTNRSMHLIRSAFNYYRVYQLQNQHIDAAKSDEAFRDFFSDEGKVDEDSVKVQAYEDRFMEEVRGTSVRLRPMHYKDMGEKEAWARQYSLEKELMVINRKRIVRESYQISATLADVLSNVLTLTGPGATAGAVIGGVSLVAKAARPIFRIGKQKLRDIELLKNADKTTKAKHQRRMDLIREIFYLISEMKEEEDVEELKKKSHTINIFLHAAGTSINELYYAGNNKQRIKLLYRALRSRE